VKTIAVLLTAVLTLSAPTPAFAYLKFGVRVGAEVVDVRWSRPVAYFINERSVPGVSAETLRDAVTRAFSTWRTAAPTMLQTQFQAFTTAPPGVQDGRTTLGFLDRPDLDRVLGATTFLLDAATGEILESDVFFNTRFDWSASPSGEPGRVDLESVAVHEIGHLLGLGHSALGETEMIPGGRRVIASGAVMFPIAFSPGATADRMLQPDDIAGLRELYPSADFTSTSASISGHVTKNGAGVYGAHVVAVNLETGESIGGFSLDSEGVYVIGGLAPGAYVVRVEPLDDADTDSFFTGPIDVDFAVTYGSQVVIAPAGGSADTLDITVRPK
jgi:hypothetical protein